MTVDAVAGPEQPNPPIHRLVRQTAAVGLYLVDQLGLTVKPRHLRAVSDYGDARYVLGPGRYAFEYDRGGFSPVYGAISLYPVGMPRGKDFIRHTSIVLTPDPSGGASVLTEADLDRARKGDVVTKVVFVAHTPAIRERIDDIDRGMRELARLRTSLEEQKSFWDRKLANRRLNTRYSSDFGWGIDVPSMDLALLQAIVGPERYHWHRFTQAEDQVRTYEAKLAELDLPQRRLREERDALKKILNTSDVIHRSNDMMVLTSSMIRPYHDPVFEVVSYRGGDVWRDSYQGKFPFRLNDWAGPWGKVHFPYWYSSLALATLPPGLRPVAAPSAAATKNIGEVLMVTQIGSRRPVELGGGSAIHNR